MSIGLQLALLTQLLFASTPDCDALRAPVHALSSALVNISTDTAVDDAEWLRGRYNTVCNVNGGA